MTGNKKVVIIERGIKMSPRALTAEEREIQKKQFLEISKKLVIERGIRNVSVDDITKACKVAKGTFYNYYDNKESLFLEMVWQIYSQVLAEAEALLKKTSPENIRQAAGGFLKSFLYDPQQVFFFSNHDELEHLLTNTSGEQMDTFHDREVEAFERILRMLGRDTGRVKPTVVHNYIHAMYLASINHAMIIEAMMETIDVMVEGLLHYIFNEEKEHVVS